MIKLPDLDLMVSIWNKTVTLEAFHEKYNAEILRINEPAKPEFPESWKYATFDEHDGWWMWAVKPDYTDHIGWYTSDEQFHSQPDFALTSKEILWLEHINAGKSPSESLICLEDYK